MSASALLALLPARAAAPHPAALQPLSERDMRRIDETGCEFAFNDVRNRSFVFSMNDKLMIHTTAGVTVCRPASAALDAFTLGRGSMACGGRTLTLRKAGRAAHHEEADSTTFPATLTVRAGKISTVLGGTAGTAC